MKKYILGLALSAAMLSCTKEEVKPTDPRDKFVGTWKGNMIITTSNGGSTSLNIEWVIEKNGSGIVIFEGADRITGNVNESVIVTDQVSRPATGASVVMKQGNVYYKGSYLEVAIPFSYVNLSSGYSYTGKYEGNLNK